MVVGDNASEQIGSPERADQAAGPLLRIVIEADAPSSREAHYGHAQVEQVRKRAFQFFDLTLAHLQKGNNLDALFSLDRPAEFNSDHCVLLLACYRPDYLTP